jgi:alginate O-acetyltransferase complex protein AlgI
MGYQAGFIARLNENPMESPLTRDPFPASARQLTPCASRRHGAPIASDPPTQSVVFSSHLFLFYFLPLSLVLYYAAPKTWRIGVLALTGYAFYGWWNPWFCLLMLVSTAIDYFGGLLVGAPGATSRQRRLGLVLSVTSNLLILGFFKYAGLAVGEASDVAAGLGWGTVNAPEWVTRIVLPVGISFYTFQSMSYCIDLYRGHARRAPSFLHFAAYVSLYPQLVAGPIVRYETVAEQLVDRPHTAAGFTYGLTRFSVGFAKKILLANPMGPVADAAFGAHPEVLGATTAWIGLTAYALQIYFDFSAYSDMAIGLGKMFGFTFDENFASPYRARSVTEFWRRWHISLSTFLRDYLYIPLGGNRSGSSRTYVNLLTVLVLGGLWHGASWTFVAWGALHGGVLGLERLLGRAAPTYWLPRPLAVGLTFLVVLAGWVFFRSDTFGVAAHYFQALAGIRGTADTADLLLAEMTTPYTLGMLVIGLGVVFFVPNSQSLLRVLTAGKVAAALGLLILAVALMFTQGFNPFLYFQF